MNNVLNVYQKAILQGVRVTKGEDRNHDLFLLDGELYAISKNEQCQNSSFGSIRYLVSLIYKYKNLKLNEFTKEGLKILEEHFNKYNCLVTDYLK